MIQQNTDRRKYPRIDHCGDYYIAQDIRQKVICELRNISVTGACIISDVVLKQDEFIELHVCRSRDIPLRAQVVWIRDNEYGISFLLDTKESFDNISYIMNNEISDS
jgi:hypothetical protein